MRGILIGAASLAALAPGLPAAAAERCEDAIQSWERSVTRYPSRVAERDAGEEYQRAREAQRRGDNERCLDHMDRAVRIYREESAAARGEGRYADTPDRRDERREGSGSSGGSLDAIIRNLGDSLGK